MISLFFNVVLVCLCDIIMYQGSSLVLENKVFRVKSPCLNVNVCELKSGVGNGSTWVQLHFVLF